MTIQAPDSGRDRLFSAWGRGELDDVGAAIAGDETAFARIVEHHTRELQVHCYRMLGSLGESEELVQETFLRAWQKRATFEGRSTFRAWLYRIATNACLDLLRRRRRRPQAYDPAVGFGATDEPPPFLPWLEPYPDDLLGDGAPDARIVGRETVSLGFLVAIQHLPPRQRAVFLLAEVLDWSATEIASLLDVSVAAVKSALQRARDRIRTLSPTRDTAEPATHAQRALLERYMGAHEHGDLTAMAELLAEEVRLTMPPHPVFFVGRKAVLELSRQVFDPSSPHYHGIWRSRPVRANHQLAVAHYCERPSAPLTRDQPGRFRAQVLDVLRVEDGRVTEIMAFEPILFQAFGLPLDLSSEESAHPQR